MLGSVLITQTGCYGSFSLLKKVYDWNGSIEDKFVRSIVYWALCIIPIYPLSAFIDSAILNVIEFWSGSNPLSMKEGQHEEQIITCRNGRFRVEASRNTFRITPLDRPGQQETVEMRFTPGNLTWNKVQGEELLPVCSLVEDKDGWLAVKVYTQSGVPAMVTHPDGLQWDAWYAGFLARNGEENMAVVR